MQWWKKRRQVFVIGSAKHPLVLKQYSLCAGRSASGAENEEEVERDDIKTHHHQPNNNPAKTTFNEGK